MLHQSDGPDLGPSAGKTRQGPLTTTNWTSHDRRVAMKGRRESAGDTKRNATAGVRSPARVFGSGWRYAAIGAFSWWRRSSDPRSQERVPPPRGYDLVVSSATQRSRSTSTNSGTVTLPTRYHAHARRRRALSRDPRCGGTGGEGGISQPGIGRLPGAARAGGQLARNQALLQEREAQATNAPPPGRASVRASSLTRRRRTRAVRGRRRGSTRPGRRRQAGSVYCLHLSPLKLA